MSAVGKHRRILPARLTESNHRVCLISVSESHKSYFGRYLLSLELNHDNRALGEDQTHSIKDSVVTTGPCQAPCSQLDRKNSA